MGWRVYFGQNSPEYTDRVATTKRYGYLKVRYFGTYREEYSRNQIMIEGLRRAGVDVVECHVELWISTD
jgi:hypothetical protein